MNNKADKKDWQHHKNFALPKFYSQWQDWNPKLDSNNAIYREKPPTQQQELASETGHLIDIYKAHNESNLERFSSNSTLPYIEYNWELTKTDN